MPTHIPGSRYLEFPGVDHLPFVGDNAGDIADAIEEFLTGSRAPVAVDRVLATVLFTDIVGSTEKAAALGDHRWRDLLDTHHTAIRRTLSRFRGHEIKTTGDGVLATFDGPARGVRCACAIADEIRPLGIEVRAGLHTGECEVIGDDIGGIAVHIGARVAALAGASEVLVSGTVKDLVAGSGFVLVTAAIICSRVCREIGASLQSNDECAALTNSDLTLIRSLLSRQMSLAGQKRRFDVLLPTAARPDVPVIMITAYGDDSTRRKALEGGAEALLTKPIDFVALRGEIDNRMAGAGAQVR